MALILDNQFDLRFVEKSTTVSIVFNRVALTIKNWFGIVGAVLLGIALLPIIVIFGLIFNPIYSRLDKSFKMKVTNKEDLKKLSFNELMEFEKHLLILKSKLDRSIDKIEFWPFNKISERSVSILKSTDLLLEQTKFLYTLQKEDVFTSDEDFTAYQNALADLADVWSYDSTVEEKREAYNLKKKK